MELSNDQIRKWMKDNYQDHVDPITGILCMTTLAEDCSIALRDTYANDQMFDMAWEVAEDLQLLD